MTKSTIWERAPPNADQCENETVQCSPVLRGGRSFVFVSAAAVRRHRRGAPPEGVASHNPQWVCLSRSAKHHHAFVRRLAPASTRPGRRRPSCFDEDSALRVRPCPFCRVSIRPARRYGVGVSGAAPLVPLTIIKITIDLLANVKIGDWRFERCPIRTAEVYFPPIWHIRPAADRGGRAHARNLPFLSDDSPTPDITLANNNNPDPNISAATDGVLLWQTKQTFPPHNYESCRIGNWPGPCTPARMETGT